MNISSKMKGLTGKSLLTLAFTGFALSGIRQEAQAQKVKKSSRAGVGVYEIAINPKDNYLYVTAIGTRQNPKGAIMKINPKNLKVVDSFVIPESQPFGIALNGKTQIAYTSNTIGNSVTAVDLKTGKVLANIKGPGEKSHTRELIVDEDNNLIYVSDVSDNSSIWVIDGNTNTLKSEIKDLGKNVTGMVFSPKKDKIYITILGDEKVGIIDVASQKLEKSFASGGEGPINIASNGTHLFVTNRKSHNVTVLTLDGTIVKTIATGDGAIGIALDEDNNRLYSANRGSGTTTIIDTKTFEVIKDVPTGSHPNNVKIGNKGQVYVLNKAKGGKKGDTTPLPADPNGDTITLIKF